MQARVACEHNQSTAAARSIRGVVQPAWRRKSLIATDPRPMSPAARAGAHRPRFAEDPAARAGRRELTGNPSALERHNLTPSPYNSAQLKRSGFSCGQPLCTHPHCVRHRDSGVAPGRKQLAE